MMDQRPAGHRVKRFGKRGLHARAKARGEDDDCRFHLFDLPGLLLQIVRLKIAQGNKPQRDDEFHTLLHAHVEVSDLVFWKDEQKSGGGVRRGGDKDGHERSFPADAFALHFTGHETHAVASLARVLDQGHAVKTLLHGEGLHDLLYRGINAPHQRHLLHEPVAVPHKPLPEIIGGKHADQDHKKDESDDSQARKFKPDELPRQMPQHTVDNTQKRGQYIIGRPQGDEDQETRNKILFYEILKFFHGVNITDFTLRLQAFFQGLRADNLPFTACTGARYWLYWTWFYQRGFPEYIEPLIMIIPFFIPHAGCPHQCVFCNQNHITGQDAPVAASSIRETIAAYLETSNTRMPVQIAFYGGSFTALPRETQREYLEAAYPFITSGQIAALRLSTRPDCISAEILDLLQKYQVTIVELGAQSMDDQVLARSGRGHTAADTVNAVNLLKNRGFTIGLQLMPGLPGDSPDRFMDTIDRVIALRPDFVRIYPALVIRNTPLAELYTSGRYAPLSLDDAVILCKQALIQCESAGIEVIRIGLQATRELEKPGTILAGPHHPAFRQLVESSILLDEMRTVLAGWKEKKDTVTLLVNPKEISVAIGQKKANRKQLINEFHLRDIHIQPSVNIPKGSVQLKTA